MRAQAERFGTEIIQGNVTTVDLSRRPFTIDAARRPSYTADALIIATGASARLARHRRPSASCSGHGVSTCATCDGYFFRGKPIAVVGGGDSAMEEAIFLTKFASQGDGRPSPRHAARVEDHAGQGVRQPEDRVRLEHRGRRRHRRRTRAKSRRSSCATSKTGARTELPVDGVFIAIGHTPNTALFKGQLELDANGYIVTHDGTRDERPGVFAARRRAGSRLPPGDHRRRLRLHGGDRRRALPRRPAPAPRRTRS